MNSTLQRRSLCATKDDEVVEYALARTTSPTLVAEYQTLLPPKHVLRAKLHELYAQFALSAAEEEATHDTSAATYSGRNTSPVG